MMRCIGDHTGIIAGVADLKTGTKLKVTVSIVE